MIDVHPDVRAALERGAPVVALESTIIAHGMPHPHNVAVARALEGIVRSGGATPATIAVIGGRIKIGLDDDALEWLGTARDVRKLSRGDLGHAIVTRTHGATTVAATMRCAHLAGIAVFATGGIGGVHRGARRRRRWTISADLDEPRAHTGRRRLRGCQSASRPAENARSARDAGRSGRRLRHGRVSGVLEPGQRAAPWPAARSPPPTSPR